MIKASTAVVGRQQSGCCGAIGCKKQTRVGLQNAWTDTDRYRGTDPVAAGHRWSDCSSPPWCGRWTETGPGTPCSRSARRSRNRMKNHSEESCGAAWIDRRHRSGRDRLLLPAVDRHFRTREHAALSWKRASMAASRGQSYCRPLNPNSTQSTRPMPRCHHGDGDS